MAWLLVVDRERGANWGALGIGIWFGVPAGFKPIGGLASSGSLALVI